MPLLVPPGFSHNVVQFQQAGDAEPMVCTFGTDNSDVAGGLEEIPNLLFTAWQDTILVSQTNNITLVGVTSYVGQDGGPPVPYDSDVPSTPGSGTQEPLPSNCAMLIRKRTSQSGRRGRGRMYVPGVAEGTVDANGVVATATVNAWQDRLDGFMELLVLGGQSMVVLHNSEGVSPATAPTPVALLLCENKIATQRQRMRP